MKIIKKNIAEGDLDRFSQLRQLPRASPFFLFGLFSFFEPPFKVCGKNVASGSPVSDDGPSSRLSGRPRFDVSSRVKPGHIVGFFLGLIFAVGLVPKTDRVISEQHQDMAVKS